MALLIPIAFAAGLLTALSPCVLPVLPVILASGGASNTQRRPYAIVAGLVSTFTLLTLAGAWLWSLLHISAKYQMRIGAVALLVLALTLLLPKAGELLERPLLFLTRRRVFGDVGGGFLLGASLGLVFVPCTGPVLGAVITNVGSHTVGLKTVVSALAYAIGLSVPLLALAIGSRKVAASFREHAPTIRVAAGVIMSVVAVVLFANPKWLTDVQQHVPSYVDALQPKAASKLPKLQLASSPVKVPLNNYGSAPEFKGISHWINTPGLSMDALRGKVVLIDFWTYSCINCLRTLPYLKSWNEQYAKKGLVIVGVHTPEFAFEHDLGNVRDATRRYGVRYPVAIDNDYKTWNAYSNQYWPAEYLVDQGGNVRHIHFGEGDYDTTEHDIRLLLKAGGQSVLPKPKAEHANTPSGDITPESYLGYFRIERYAGSPLQADVDATYHFPASLDRDEFAYDGRWKVERERIVAGDGARLRLHFHARNVYIVLGGHGLVGVYVNGKPSGSIRVNGDRLYTVAASRAIRDGTLELTFTPGLQAYSFTFG